jgi:hypothetical protein
VLNADIEQIQKQENDAIYRFSQQTFDFQQDNRDDRNRKKSGNLEKIKLKKFNLWEISLLRQINLFEYVYEDWSNSLLESQKSIEYYEYINIKNKLEEISKTLSRLNTEYDANWSDIDRVDVKEKMIRTEELCKRRYEEVVVFQQAHSVKDIFENCNQVLKVDVRYVDENKCDDLKKTIMQQKNLLNVWQRNNQENRNKIQELNLLYIKVGNLLSKLPDYEIYLNQTAYEIVNNRDNGNNLINIDRIKDEQDSLIRDMYQKIRALDEISNDLMKSSTVQQAQEFSAEARARVELTESVDSNYPRRNPATSEDEQVNRLGM